MEEKRFFLSNKSLADDFNLLITALNASSTSIILTDNQQPDNPIIFCNKAFEVMTGYTRNEIIGRNCRFLQGNDRQQEGRFRIKEAVEKGESITVELRNYRKNGSQFWNELYMSPIRNQNNQITHFIGVQNDITSRKKIEAELHSEREMLEKRVHERTLNLKASEEYQRSIVETVRESLMVLGQDIKVISANEFFYKTFRVSPKETVSKSLYELGNGQWNIPSLRYLLEKVLPNNNPFENFEVEHDFPNIGKKIMVLNARRIDVEGNYKNRILLAIEDISERRQADIRKDDFLSVASHELKTPLTTVKGYIQMLEIMIPARQDQKLFEITHKADNYINKLSGLITDLLDVSKLRAGKLELSKKPFDFDAMISSCVETVQAGTKSHTIDVTGQTEITFDGDENRIEQVMTNLLTNAIKYSPDATRVAVHLNVINEFVKVTVTDFGLGINEEDQKKIFERFYRVGSIQKDFPGMGIGLYVCEQIVKSHNGSLWVESEEGKGATFSFTLPYLFNNQNQNDAEI